MAFVGDATILNMTNKCSFCTISMRFCLEAAADRFFFFFGSISSWLWSASRVQHRLLIVRVTMSSSKRFLGRQSRRGWVTLGVTLRDHGSERAGDVATILSAARM